MHDGSKKIYDFHIKLLCWIENQISMTTLKEGSLGM